MQTNHETYIETIQNFRMPAYTEIPDVGLYLEQVTKFVSEYLTPIQCVNITGSMISNYVKKKLVKNPVKKQYGRDQIAVILFIAVAKTVISLEEVQVLLNMQEETYPIREAYEYFCRDLEAALRAVFDLGEEMSPVSGNNPMEKKLLKNILITVAYKEYLDYSFRSLTVLP